MKKHILIALFLATLTCISSKFTTGEETIGFSSPVVTNIFSVALPRADRISYQFALIDGKLYRRLYNFTQNIPLGPWELIK